MAVDKLVDSAQLDADLMSIANAIRTKGGTSAQLAFPADFVSAIAAISGGGVSSVFRLEDFKMPSAKWLIQNAIPNVLKTGGCIHIKGTVINGNSDVQQMCFGYGALSAWSPSNYVNVLIMDYSGGDGSSLRFRFRGPSIDGTIYLSSYVVNRAFDLKLYSNKLVDVLTGAEYALSTFGTGVTDAMASILAQNYLSVGQNYSAPPSGHILPLFAFEES